MNYAVMLFAIAAVLTQDSGKYSCLNLDVRAEVIRTEFANLPRDQVIVDDAVVRFSKSKNVNQAMRGRLPIVFHTPSARCVEMHLLAPSLGGSPVYCYKKDRDVLTEKDEEVD